MKFDGIAVCTVTHQEYFVVIYAPCTKSVHESVHDRTLTPGSFLLRSQYFRVMIIAAPSSALMQKELVHSMCGYNSERSTCARTVCSGQIKTTNQRTHYRKEARRSLALLA